MPKKMTSSAWVEFSDSAKELIHTSLVWENHCCPAIPANRASLLNLPRYKNAGFDMVHLNVGDSDVPLEETIRALAIYRASVLEDFPGITSVASIADLDQAQKLGKMGVAFDLEGAHSIGTDVTLISLLYDLGVRWMLIAYNRANALGSGCHDQTDAGLTKFGRRCVAEMERIGMTIDVAHTGFRTAHEVIEMANVPVNISHSNPQGINSHPRCVPDDLMIACARRGGVLGITGSGLFLGRNDASAENLAISIEYAVETMGEDHVGLGLDFVFEQDALTSEVAKKRDIWPEGFGYDQEVSFAPPEILHELVSHLLARGMSGAQVQKILGENFRRVANATWR